VAPVEILLSLECRNHPCLHWDIMMFLFILRMCRAYAWLVNWSPTGRKIQGHQADSKFSFIDGSSLVFTGSFARAIRLILFGRSVLLLLIFCQIKATPTNLYPLHGRIEIITTTVQSGNTEPSSLCSNLNLPGFLQDSPTEVNLTLISTSLGTNGLF
jgi:hypothetical protein